MSLSLKRNLFFPCYCQKANSERVYQFRQEPTPHLLERLARMGTFAVATCPQRPDGGEVIPAHAGVIQPLLRAASAVLVWPPSKTARQLSYPAEILVRERGRHAFDLSRDILSGYEYFWNAVAWRRGSLVIRIDQALPDMNQVFAHCSGPALLWSRHQLAKGDSIAALRYCDAAADQGAIAFCFSASNGIEHLSVFAAEKRLASLYLTAYESCRPFDQ